MLIRSIRSVKQLCEFHQHLWKVGSIKTYDRMFLELTDTERERETTVKDHIEMGCILIYSIGWRSLLARLRIGPLRIDPAGI